MHFEYIMEFICTLLVVILCLDNPTERVKTFAAILWLLTLFFNYVVEPEQMDRAKDAIRRFMQTGKE